MERYSRVKIVPFHALRPLQVVSSMQVSNLSQEQVLTIEQGQSNKLTDPSCLTPTPKSFIDPQLI